MGERRELIAEVESNERKTARVRMHRSPLLTPSRLGKGGTMHRHPERTVPSPSSEKRSALCSTAAQTQIELTSFISVTIIAIFLSVSLSFFTWILSVSVVDVSTTFSPCVTGFVSLLTRLFFLSLSAGCDVCELCLIPSFFVPSELTGASKMRAEEKEKAVPCFPFARADRPDRRGNLARPVSTFLPPPAAKGDWCGQIDLGVSRFFSLRARACSDLTTVIAKMVVD